MPAITRVFLRARSGGRARADRSSAPRARQLAEPLLAAMHAIERTLEPPTEFVPATTRRAFRLGATDTTLAVVLPSLLGRIADAAPGVAITTAPMRSNAETFERLSTGGWDLAIGRYQDVPDGIRSSRLFTDRMVCLARADHPRIRRRLSLERYVAESHVSIEPVEGPEQPFTIESLLREQGLERRVVSRLDNLAMAPFVVARTDLLCTAPLRTIEPFAEGLGLRILPPPFEAPSFDLDLAWHASLDADPANAWLRGELLALLEA